MSSIGIEGDGSLYFSLGVVTTIRAMNPIVPNMIEFKIVSSISPLGFMP